MAKVGMMQKYRMQMRSLKKSRGRARMMKQIPWFLDDEIIAVMDCVNPNGRKPTEVIETGLGKDFGLMFENAGKEIITVLKCPECGAPAELNMNWPAFFCNGKHEDGNRRIWEKL